MTNFPAQSNVEIIEEELSEELSSSSDGDSLGGTNHHRRAGGNLMDSIREMQVDEIDEENNEESKQIAFSV